MHTLSEPTLILPREGEIVGDSHDRRVEILSEHDSLHATWSRFGPRRDGADLHVHYEHVDLFYVLAGELTVRLGADGEPVAVPPGTLARMPPGVVHGFRNAAGAELRYINLHAPGRGFAGYMRAMRDGRELSYDQHEPPPGGGRPPSEAVIGGAQPQPDGSLVHADVEEIGIVERHGAEPVPRAARDHVRSLYVLDGELLLGAGEQRRAPAGTWLQVPPGVPHSLAFPMPARYLDIRTPG